MPHKTCSLKDIDLKMTVIDRIRTINSRKKQSKSVYFSSKKYELATNLNIVQIVNSYPTSASKCSYLEIILKVINNWIS